MSNTLVIFGCRAIQGTGIHLMSQDIRDAGFKIVVCGGPDDHDEAWRTSETLGADDFHVAADSDLRSRVKCLRYLISRLDSTPSLTIVASNDPIDREASEIVRTKRMYPHMIERQVQQIGGVDKLLSLYL
jgi:hypothetical protein